MISLYAYNIKLIDPLFFAREGISGAFTPPYIHATALNHALTWAMGRCQEEQPYFMSDSNGGRNIPRYETSQIDKDFYITPAKTEGSPSYYTEIVKGDGDKTIQVGYGAKRGGIGGKNEVLKAYRIYSIAPETVFEGYLYTKLEIEQFPSLIRLGSFRGLAIFEIDGPKKVVGKDRSQYCDHPVDPLVSKVLSGTPVPMLPYPIIEHALVENVWEIRRHRQRVFVASMFDNETDKVQPVRNKAAFIV